MNKANGNTIFAVQYQNSLNPRFYPVLYPNFSVANTSPLSVAETTPDKTKQTKKTETT